MTVPFGSVPNARVDAARLTVMLTGAVVVCAGLLESVVVTVMVVVPAVVGVPVTVQFAFKVRPAGSALVDEHVYGPVPPLTPIGAVYGVLTVPFGRVPLRVKEVVALPTVIVNVAVAFAPAASCACAAKVKLPGVDGVPVIEPVEAPRLSPGASAPDVTLHV